MLKKLKVRSKLLVSFGIVLLLTIIISVYSVLQLQKASENLKEFMDGAVAADDLVKSSRISTFIAAKNIRDMIIRGKSDAATKQDIDEKVETIRANLKEVQELDILSKEQVTELNNVYMRRQARRMAMQKRCLQRYISHSLCQKPEAVQERLLNL